MMKEKKLFSFSIHKKLFLISTVLTLSVIISFHFLSHKIVSNSLIQDHASYELNSFTQAGEYIQSVFEMTEGYLQQVYKNKIIYQYTTEKDAYSDLLDISKQISILDHELNNIFIQQNYIDNIILINKNNFSYSYNWGTSGQYLGENLDFDNFLKHSELLTSTNREGTPIHYKSKLPNNLTENKIYSLIDDKIIYTRSLRDHEGTRVGLVIVIFNTHFMNDFFSDLPDYQAVALYDNSNELIWSKTNNNITLDFDQFKRNTYYIDSTQDNTYLYVSQKIWPYNFTLVSQAPLESVLTKQNEVNTYTILYGLLFILFVTVFSYLYSKRISAPLYKLASNFSQDLSYTLAHFNDGEEDLHGPRLIPKQNTIKYKLITYFILSVIIPNILYTSIIFFTYYDYYKDQTILRTQDTIELVKQNIEHNFNKYDSVTSQMCYSDVIQDYYDTSASDHIAIDQVFTQTQMIKQDILALNLYDVKGNNIYSSNYYSPYSIGITSEDFKLLTSKSTGKLELMNTTNNYFTTPVLTFARTVRSKQKHNFTDVIGYGVFYMDQTLLNNLYSQNLDNNSEYFFMMDQEVNIFDHAKKALTADLLSSNDIFENNNLQDPRGFITLQDDNEDYLLIYDTTDMFEFKIMGVIPYHTISSKLEPVVNYIVIYMVTFFIIIIIISSLIAFNITKRLKLLQGAMKDVAKYGDFTIQLNITGQDEISILSNQFNHMISRLNELIKENYQSKIREQELLVLEKEAQLNALQQQINPHFLYNTLESIKWMAYKKGNMDICNMINALGNFFRGSIAKSNNLILFSEEIEHLENYLYIQRLRYREKLSISCHIEEEVKICKTIKLILQPLVENAINHGIDSMESGGLITINGSIQGNEVHIFIQDNGTGMSSERLKEVNDALKIGKQDGYTSIGLKNVYNRLKYNFNDNANLIIESSMGHGTTVKIILPAVK
ncbi:cache domain-containing sensor histidine kinase [Vallitalea okinawensis]|uniref:cache domain-containing sensor histidine kinase n=1 Tax=Vallitalea okinawensis TaxID=2078660 RepID=UPI000CFD2868|nr:sensor histidine kinase [Vallitalea okinawensis]